MAGANVVAGSADGTHPFGNVANAWWVGQPDSPNTTVIYLISQPWDCPKLVRHGGWDAMVPQGTQIIEFKMTWPGATQPTASTTYTVTSSMALGGAPPAAGSAFALWVLGPVVGAVVETPADTGGTLTLAQYNAGTNATGTFQIKYGANTLSGGFDAKWCPTGGEP